MKIPHKHAAISVRNPQAARPRSRSALQQANTLRRSEITNFRVSSALECLAHVMEARWRQDFTRGDRCPRLHAPPNGFHFDGNWVLVWLFFRPRVRGSQGTSPFEFRQYRQTRFGYARSKRSRPQFKAHNSVRPFENGLRSLGSSATRPDGAESGIGDSLIPEFGRIGNRGFPPRFPAKSGIGGTGIGDFRVWLGPRPLTGPARSDPTLGWGGAPGRRTFAQALFVNCTMMPLDSSRAKQGLAQRGKGETSDEVCCHD